MKKLPSVLTLAVLASIASVFCIGQTSTFPPNTFTGLKVATLGSGNSTQTLDIQDTGNPGTDFFLRNQIGTLQCVNSSFGAILCTIDQTGNATFTSLNVTSGAFAVKSTVAFTNGAAAAAGTLGNAPTAGNPTKWIPISDNGTTRYIPAW